MRLSRRQFIGLLGGLGLSSCSSLGLDEVKAERFKPNIHFGKEGPLTFAAINDLHVLDAKSTAIVNRAVHHINEQPHIHFTVALGDVATDGKLQEINLVNTCLDKLQQPYFCVPGNHDVDLAASNIYANYERAFGACPWTEGEEGWRFIGLDTCNGAASDVTVPHERMAWLEAHLKKIKPERPIALFTHHPFNPNTKAYRVQNAEQVLDLFSGHNLRLVASGHYHGNQVEERNGILFTTTACCSSTRNNFDGTPAKGYRLFRIEGDRIEHEFIEVSG